MQNFDLNYICTKIGNLSGIPIRLYQEHNELLFYSMVNLPKDPMILYKEELLTITDKVGYFATENLNYYGIFNIDNYKIILGPTRLIPNSKQDLHEMALRMDIPGEEIDEFVNGMDSIVGLPLELLMQMLCLLNYFFHNEQLELSDITIYESQQDSYERSLAEQQINQLMHPATEKDFYRGVSNIYSTENTMTDIVRKGDISALEEWQHSPQAVQSIPLATDILRHHKNSFITTATLVSRAAIQGGMNQNDALSLANGYIKKCELHNTLESISNLQYHMISSFTYKVHQLRLGHHPSKLAIDVANYVQHHLSSAITTQEIADALYTSRPHLSKKFKEETGQKLCDFITKQKIDEAKRLLKYTDKPLLAIAVYLGFSSQSHFTRVFKKITGKTPSEYR